MYFLRSVASLHHHHAAVRLYSRCLYPSSRATEKLYDILEEYRRQNYRQTLPSRFVKELLKYTDENKDGLWSQEEFKSFLKNIGAGDKLTQEEVSDIMQHVSGDGTSDEISISKVQKVFLEELTARKSS